MAFTAEDTFVEAGAAVIVTSHTPTGTDAGTGWTEDENTTTVPNHLEVQGSSAGTASPNVNDGNDRYLYSLQPDPTTADVECEVTYSAVDTSSSSKSTGVYLRFQDTDNYYFMIKYRDASGNDTRIYKKVTGTTTLLAQGDHGTAAGDIYKFEASGTTLNVYRDSGSGFGTAVLSVTDSDISAAGKAGLLFGSPAISTDDISTNWDVSHFGHREVGGETTLVAGELTQAQALDAGTLTQVHSLPAEALDQTQTLDAPVLTQAHVLAVLALDQAQLLDSTAISTGQILVAAALLQAQTLDAPGITQNHVLASGALDQVQVLDATTLSQVHVLATAALDQAQALDTAELVLLGSLVAASLTQAQTLDSPGLVQNHLLVSAALDQTQVLDATGLSQGHVLTAGALNQGQAFDAVTLSQNHILAASELNQAQVLDATTVLTFLAMAAEARRIVVQAENRTLRVEHEDRVLSVAREDRTIVIKAGGDA